MAKRAAKRPIGQLIARDFQQNKWKYLMILPVVVYFILFAYKPMYGIIIAFKNYRPTLGIMESPWVGLNQFTTFFRDPYFWRLLRNTFTISGLSILFGFPAPILLALPGWLIGFVLEKLDGKGELAVYYNPETTSQWVELPGGPWRRLCDGTRADAVPFGEKLSGHVELAPVSVNIFIRQ